MLFTCLPFGGVLPPMNLRYSLPISLLICFSTTWHCFLPTELSYHLVKEITLGRPTVAGGKQPAERWMKKMILTIWMRQWNKGGRASRSCWGKKNEGEETKEIKDHQGTQILHEKSEEPTLGCQYKKLKWVKMGKHTIHENRWLEDQQTVGLSDFKP